MAGPSVLSSTHYHVINNKLPALALSWWNRSSGRRYAATLLASPRTRAPPRTRHSGSRTFSLKCEPDYVRGSMDGWMQIRARERDRQGRNTHHYSGQQSICFVGVTTKAGLQYLPSHSAWFHLVGQFHVTRVHVKLPLPLSQDSGQDCTCMDAHSHVHRGVGLLLHVSDDEGQENK